MSAGGVVLDLVAPQSPSYRGRGIARHALAFAEELVDRHPDLVESVLVHPELPPAPDMDRLMASGKVATELGAGPDGGIFHVTSAFEPEVPVRSLWPRGASARRMRLAVTVYDLIPDIFPDMYLQDPGLRRRWRSGRELVRVADHVFTLSLSAQSDVVEMLGVPASRVSVIGSGCDSRFHTAADPGEALETARGGVPGLRGPFVVCNGAIDPRKNLTRLVESFSLAAPHLGDDLQLVIACRANDLEKNHFLVMADRLGVGGRVLLPGFVPDEVLVALYQTARLAIFPSLYEGYGLPVIEAQACGALVVAGDNSSLREITPEIGRFDATDTAAMASVIARATGDEDFRRRLREATPTAVPSWADVADRAAEGYRQILDGDRATGGLLPGWRRRPAVAVVLSGEAGGRCGELLAALGERADVDVFRAGAPGDEPHARPLAAYGRSDRWRGGYDLTLVCADEERSGAELSRFLEELSGPGFAIVSPLGGSACVHAGTSAGGPVWLPLEDEPAGQDPLALVDSLLAGAGRAEPASARSAGG